MNKQLAELCRIMDAFQLRDSALHECACAFMGRHFGAKCTPELTRLSSPSPNDKKGWVGTTHFPPFPFSESQRRRFILAGWLALVIIGKGGDFSCSEEDMHLSLKSYEAPSQDQSYFYLADWESLQWTEEDLRCVLEFLKENWDQIINAAQLLISAAMEEDARVSALEKRHSLRKPKVR